MSKGSRRRPGNQKAYAEGHSKVLGWNEEDDKAAQALEALERLETKRKQRSPDHLEMLIDRLEMGRD